MRQWWSTRFWMVDGPVLVDSCLWGIICLVYNHVQMVVSWWSWTIGSDRGLCVSVQVMNAGPPPQAHHRQPSSPHTPLHLLPLHAQGSLSKQWGSRWRLVRRSDTIQVVHSVSLSRLFVYTIELKKPVEPTSNRQLFTLDLIKLNF